MTMDIVIIGAVLVMQQLAPVGIEKIQRSQAEAAIKRYEQQLAADYGIVRKYSLGETFGFKEQATKTKSRPTLNDIR